MSTRLASLSGPARRQQALKLQIPGTRTSGRGSLSTSARRLQTTPPPPPQPALPARKPIGAFRGGLFGFLLGTTAGAWGSYYYLLDGYARSNDLLNEDLYAVQAAVSRLHSYVASLDAKLDALEDSKRRGGR